MKRSFPCLKPYFTGEDCCSEFEYREQLHCLIDSSTELLRAEDDRMAPLPLLREIRAEASRRLWGLDHRPWWAEDDAERPWWAEDDAAKEAV